MKNFLRITFLTFCASLSAFYTEPSISGIDFACGVFVGGCAMTLWCWLDTVLIMREYPIKKQAE